MRHMLGVRRIRAAFAGAALTAVAVAIVGAGPVEAGTWMRNSCVNPDGSAAGSDGWTGYGFGAPSAGSFNKATCPPGEPMLATLGAQSAAPSGAAEVLQYTPPDGSTLVGGRAVIGLNAWGYGDRAIATAAVYTPSYWHDYTNVVLQCAAIVWPCQNGSASYFGRVDLPADRGGNLYVSAGCLAQGGGTACTTGGYGGAYSSVGVAQANLLLSTNAAPGATDFEGSLLQPGAHGTAGLAFTATDGGPGVYRVKVAIDGKPVYDATPNTLTGKCVPVGVDEVTGALMWIWQQPCPRSQHVDLQVRTTQLRDGEHELTVTVVNPARDTTIALRRTITTNNRTTVSSTLTSDRKPGAVVGRAAPDYGVVLDAPTSALTRGVRRTWSRSALTVSGTLQQSAGVPAQGVLVTLFAKNGGEGTVQPLARTSTDAAGRWLLTAPRGPSRELLLVYGEQPDPASPKAIKIRQTVKPDVTLNVRALGRGRLRFSGRLKISPLGSPRPLVVIQTLNRNKRWQAVGTSLRVSRTGAYSVVYDGGPNVIGGRYTFRTVAHATPLFATGVSRIKRARVR